MAMLKQQIYADIVPAMKNKEQVKLDALRMLKSEIMKFEVSGAKKEANDEEVVKIIKKLIKQRQDSASQFEAAGRTESAEKEKQEILFLEIYLPAQMSEGDIEKIILTSIAETGFKSKSDFGKIMGVVMQKTTGNADGALVKDLLQKHLV